MEQIQDILTQWWASSDDTARGAVIAFGSFLLITMIFSIIGTYTNPTRRPHNEVDFRKFLEARLASEAKPLTSKPAEEEPIDGDDRDRRSSQLTRDVRTMQARRL